MSTRSASCSRPSGPVPPGTPAPAGPAINVSPIDMGTRFRVVLNEVEAVVPEHVLPKLPVARVLWTPQPNLKVGAAAWILAGGAHHSVYSQQVDTRHIEIFCEMANVELVVIDADTRLREFKRILKAGDLRLTC